MSLIYRKKYYRASLYNLMCDYWGEIAPFARRIDKKRLLIPLIFLKTIEWSIYRWYKTSIRRFYGVKGNELIYMITKRCNERCAKCGIWETPEPDSEHLKITDFIKCMKALHENLYQVTLTGGEPLVFLDDVMLIAEEAKKLSLPMITVTNGALITEDFLNRYASGDNTLVISIDTLEKEKWIEFRGNDNYDTVMKNILLAHKILKTNLKIQSVLAYETKDDVQKIKEFCDKLGISHVIQPYMDFGGSWHDYAPFKESNADVICAARKNICIYPNGDVVKCFDHYRVPLAKEPLGNIAKEDIISILCKKRATEVSRMMKTCNFECKHLSCNTPPPPYGS